MFSCLFCRFSEEKKSDVKAKSRQESRHVYQRESILRFDRVFQKRVVHNLESASRHVPHRVHYVNLSFSILLQQSIFMHSQYGKRSNPDGLFAQSVTSPDNNQNGNTNTILPMIPEATHDEDVEDQPFHIGLEQNSARKPKPASAPSTRSFNSIPSSHSLENRSSNYHSSQGVVRSISAKADIFA